MDRGQILLLDHRLDANYSEVIMTSIPHNQDGSFEYWWFLMHFLEVDDGLNVPCFIFKVSSMTGIPSGRARSTIFRLNPLEDCWFLMHILEVDDGPKVPCFNFHVSSMSGSPSG